MRSAFLDARPFSDSLNGESNKFVEEAAENFIKNLDLATMSTLTFKNTTTNQELKMHRFHIPNMTCGGCAKSVTKALLSVDPQARIETDPPAREVRVDSAMDESAFLVVLHEAGYPDKQ